MFTENLAKLPRHHVQLSSWMQTWVMHVSLGISQFDPSWRLSLAAECKKTMIPAQWAYHSVSSTTIQDRLMPRSTCQTFPSDLLTWSFIVAPCLQFVSTVIVEWGMCRDFSFNSQSRVGYVPRLLFQLSELSGVCAETSVSTLRVEWGMCLAFSFNTKSQVGYVSSLSFSFGGKGILAATQAGRTVNTAYEWSSASTSAFKCFRITICSWAFYISKEYLNFCYINIIADVRIIAYSYPLSEATVLLRNTCISLQTLIKELETDILLSVMKGDIKNYFKYFIRKKIIAWFLYIDMSIRLSSQTYP